MYSGRDWEFVTNVPLKLDDHDDDDDDDDDVDEYEHTRI